MGAWLISWAMLACLIRLNSLLCQWWRSQTPQRGGPCLVLAEFMAMLHLVNE
ncbi:hypothetical protein GLYMA_17G100501v4 [Glycine max]|nr:hypothetical protein GLYMA_17G100501v4 [Glycine max]KAH1117750.1 hypothetical protein GYH30_046832 [Glycine max]